jgi:hypothetical protein
MMMFSHTDMLWHSFGHYAVSSADTFSQRKFFDELKTKAKITFSYLASYAGAFGQHNVDD